MKRRFTSVASRRFSDLLRRGHHGADGNQCQARAALTTHFAAADGEGAHLLHQRRAGSGAAGIAHGGRPFHRGGRVEHLPAFVFVGGRHDHHVGDAAHERKVEAALMSCTVAADHAGPIDGEGDGEVLQGYIVNQLVIAALQERGVDGDHRLHARRGQARGQRDRVLLGDGDVEVAAGKALRILDQT